MKYITDHADFAEDKWWHGWKIIEVSGDGDLIKHRAANSLYNARWHSIRRAELDHFFEKYNYRKLQQKCCTL